MNTNRNKIITVAIIVIMTLFLFPLSACKAGADDAAAVKKIPDASVLRVYREVRTLLLSGDDYAARINEFIISRVKNSGYKYTEDKAGNIIVNIPASAGYEKAPRVILQSHIDKTAAFGIATILVLMSDTGPRGPLRILFTADNNGDMSGAKGLSAGKNLNGDILISMDNGRSGEIITAAPAATVLRSSMEVRTAEPEHKRAYVIAASGFSGGRPELGSEPEGDPIRIITEVLTAVRGSGILYELASFKGGTDAYHLPGEAVAVVVVGDYEMKQFRKIFGDIRDEYLSKSDDSGVDISMIETIMPKSVVLNNDMDTVMTHLYGQLTSLSTDEQASLYLNSVDLTPGRFICDTTLYCKDDDDMDESVLNQMDFQKLTAIPLEVASEVPGYGPAEDLPYIEQIKDAYKAAADKEPDFGAASDISELGFLHESNPELPIVSLGADITDPGTDNETISKKGMSIPANTVLEFLRTLRITKAK